MYHNHVLFYQYLIKETFTFQQMVNVGFAFIHFLGLIINNVSKGRKHKKETQVAFKTNVI